MDDLEVHEKLSSLKNGKCTNFDMAMKIFSLAVSSPISGYVSEVVRGAMSETGERGRAKKPKRKLLSQAWNT